MGILKCIEFKNERDYIKGSIWGLIVGDALGVPVEFKSREYLKGNPVTGMMEYGSHNQPKGTWSDDSSMTLCTLDSLCEGEIDYNDIMAKFTSWLFEGKYTPYGKVFDHGGATYRAIDRYRNGVAPLECGCRNELDNGNGSLMRILPVVLYQFEKYQHFIHCNRPAIIQPICRASALTHAHPTSLLGCGLYAQLLGTLINYKYYNKYASPCNTLIDLAAVAMEDNLVNWIGYDGAFENYFDSNEYSRLKDIRSFAALPETEIKSGGYVVNTLEAALWCFLNTDNFTDCVLKAVNLGSDTDTTAAIAGSIAGAYYGTAGIPAEWLDCIARKEWIAEIIEQFETATTPFNE